MVNTKCGLLREADSSSLLRTISASLSLPPQGQPGRVTVSWNVIAIVVVVWIPLRCTATDMDFDFRGNRFAILHIGAVVVGVESQLDLVRTFSERREIVPRTINARTLCAIDSEP